MKLEIRLFAGLKCNNPEMPCMGQREFFMEVSEGTTVGQLHHLVRLTSQYPLISMINGLARGLDWVLHDNDRIGIFPPVGGG